MPEEAEGKTPEQAKKFFLVGLLGAAAGAVTALLLTPWRGAEARRKLKEGAQKAADAAKSAAEKAADAARRARGGQDETPSD